MATAPTVETKNMRKIAAAILISIFCLPVFVQAVNYGAGAYNSGLYSASSPETTPTPSTPTPTVSGSIPNLALYAGCTSTTMFSPVTGRACPGGVLAQIPPVAPIDTTVTTSSTLVSDATTAARTITRSLSWKMKGEDVRNLQHYLNTHGYPVAPSGVGSLGKETTYFGLATKAALVKWQKAHSILPATGTYGPKSKAFVKSNQ